MRYRVLVVFIVGAAILSLQSVRGVPVAFSSAASSRSELSRSTLLSASTPGSLLSKEALENALLSVDDMPDGWIAVPPHLITEALADVDLEPVPFAVAVFSKEGSLLASTLTHLVIVLSREDASALMDEIVASIPLLDEELTGEIGEDVAWIVELLSFPMLGDETAAFTVMPDLSDDPLLALLGPLQAQVVIVRFGQTISAFVLTDIAVRGMDAESLEGTVRVAMAKVARLGLDTMQLLSVPTPTPTVLSLTDNRIAVGQTVRIVGAGSEGISLRFGPGLDYARVTILNDGTTLTVLDRSSDMQQEEAYPVPRNGFAWWRVQLRNGTTGWVAANWLQVVEWSPGTAAPAQRSARQHLDAGLQALEAADYWRAVHEYEQALALDGNLAQAYSGLGNAYLRLQQPGAAEAAYRNALRINPGDADARANLGVALYEQDRLVESEAQFRASLVLKPDDAELHYLLSATLLQQSRLGDAKEELDLALELDPALAEAWYGLGVYHKMVGDKEQAIAAFEQFLALPDAQDPRARQEAQRELQELRESVPGPTATLTIEEAIKAGVEATLTALAPTLTPTPAPTATPTATPTPNAMATIQAGIRATLTAIAPTVTPTSELSAERATPTPRPGPFGYLDLVNFSARDWPGFVQGDAASLINPAALAPLGPLGIQFSRLDVWNNTQTGNTIILAFAGVSGFAGNLFVNNAIGNPNLVLNLLPQFGFPLDIRELTIRPEMQRLPGARSNGAHLLVNLAAAGQPESLAQVDLGVVRRGNGLAAFVIVYPVNAEPDLDPVAQLRELDTRLARATP